MTIDNMPVRQAQQRPQIPEVWTLTLSRYQRDNLLLLLNAVGYPFGNEHHDLRLDEYNSGDWVGEIALMLAKVSYEASAVPSYTIDKGDSPNRRPVADRAQQTGTSGSQQVTP